jgi:DNA-binding protein H-NS
MKANELESMSVDELWTLHEEINSILVRRLAEEKAALEKRLLQLTSPDPAERFQRTRRPYPKVVPKFRNPEPPGETWSGRGKQPRWLTGQLKSGRKLGDFVIQPSSAHARREVNSSDRMTAKREKRAYPKVLPKYRNPKKRSETWAGRGKQPRWLVAQLRSGKKLEDFQIRQA